MCLPGYTLNSSENGCSISTKKVPTNCETMMDSSGAYLKCLQCNASYALDTLKANSNSACAASCSAQEANCLICYIVDTV